MAGTMRFGRRLRLPSTLEIKEEMRAAFALEEGRKQHALANHLPEDASWEAIGSHLAQAERSKKAK